MVHYIENDRLRVGVKEFGCELTSLILKDNGKEYLWQGDEKIWSGQSPILFPIVGRLYDDEYFLSGVRYSLPKHGFARKMLWKLREKTSDMVELYLEETEETLAMYPYAFEVRISFLLEENSLKVIHKVINKTSGDMYFSLGAHPAFNCSFGDKLTFDENETLATEKIDYDRSLRIPETAPVLNNERDIVITEHLFDDDALILSGIKSDNITLDCKDSRKVIFNLGKAPYLGLWAKPGAPYVCIEPWCGVNDSTDKKADFSLKDGINKLSANETFTYTWVATLS